MLCSGKEDDPELVRDSKEQRENRKGSEPKIEGFSDQRFCSLAKHCVLRPLVCRRVKTQLC